MLWNEIVVSHVSNLDMQATPHMKHKNQYSTSDMCMQLRCDLLISSVIDASYHHHSGRTMTWTLIEVFLLLTCWVPQFLQTSKFYLPTRASTWESYSPFPILKPCKVHREAGWIPNRANINDCSMKDTYTDCLVKDKLSSGYKYVRVCCIYSYLLINLITCDSGF